MQTRIFKSIEQNDPWIPVISELMKRGHEVWTYKRKCEKAVVLGGKLENPTIFDGKKVLVFHEKQWVGNWKFFEPILTEYYDEMVNVTEMSLPETIEAIIGQCS